jgi:hypothetical protein
MVSQNGRRRQLPGCRLIVNPADPSGASRPRPGAFKTKCRLAASTGLKENPEPIGGAGI